MVLQAIRYNMLQIRNLKKLKVKKLKEAAIINLFQGFPKKTYYVRIRAYYKTDGKVYYGNWSNVKKVKIKR